MGGTPEKRTIDLKFSGLKGEPGEPDDSFVRYDKAQHLTTSEQNTVLSNIGSELFVLDIENGQATLTDAQEAALLSSKGVILRGTVNAGKEVLTKIYFSDYQGGDQVSFWAVRNNRYILQCIYTKSTKLFRFLASGSFIDPNAVSIKTQTLNAAEQMQAFANLGMKVYVTDSSFLGSTLSAEEIEEVFVSKAILFADTGDLFSFGAVSSSQIYFYKFINRSSIGYITLNKPSGSVSNGSFDYQDTKALHFTAQNPALTSAQQSQAFENLGWKVHVISESAIGSSDAVSDDEKAARLSATALLVQETGEMYIYGHNSTSTPSERCFYRFRDTKTLALLNVVTTTGLITQPPFVNIYDENAVSFNIDQSGVSNDRKDKALSNIGLNWIHVPYSLLNTVLDDDTYTKITSAFGIILSDTPSDYTGPLGFIRGVHSTNTIFSSFYMNTTIAYIRLLSGNKRLFSIAYSRTYEGAVPYDALRTLTDAQKDKALSNIGLDFVHVDYSLLGTTLTDEMFAVLDNAKGIILVDPPSGYYNPRVFIKGNNGSTGCFFVSSATGTTYCQIELNKSTKVLSGVNAGLTYAGSVRYAEAQNLTDAQKQQARANIGVQSADELLADADFIAQLKTKLGIG